MENSTTYTGRADARRNDQSCLDAMVRRMVYRDRVCFASHASLAADTGLGITTVKRCLARLVSVGRIERTDAPVKTRTCAWRIPHGQRRCRKWPTTPLGRRTYKPSNLRYAQVGAKIGRPVTEIERSNLGLPEIRTARDIVAHFVDFTAATTGQPAPRRVIGMVAKYSKELLEDGIDPHVIAKATEIIVERRLHAGLLPTLIAEAALGPRQQLRYGRGMTTQQILDATKGLP